MDRIHAPGATPSNMFTEGDPGMGVPATTVSAVHMNALQEELVGIIEAAGLTPNEADNGQVLEALEILLPPANVQQDAGGGSTTGATITLATLSLPAGRWLIQADAFFKVVASTLTAATIETNVGGSTEGEKYAVWSGNITGNSQSLSRGPRIVELASTTSVVLSAFVTATGTVEVNGWLTASRLAPAV